MVSFRKFTLFLIMCCLTGSTSRSIPKEITKKGTKKGTGEGSDATTPSPSPAHVPTVAVADKDADADTPEKKAEQKAAMEAMYGGASMYADNANGATTPSPGPVHNPRGMYGESGTGTNVPVSSDKDSDEKLKLPEGAENMYAGDGGDHGDMTESNTYNGPAHDGHAHDSNAIDEASGTGTTESTTETTTRYTTPSSEKDSGEKPDEKIKLSEVAENMYADTEDDDAAHSLPYNPKGVNEASGTDETKSSDKDSDEKLKLPEGAENMYADDGFKAYDGPVHNPDGMYGESGTGTKFPEDKGDTESDAEKKTANNGADTTYDDDGNTLAKAPAHEANVAAGAAAKDADSEETVDLYGSDSIYNKVYKDQSNEKPTPFGVYEGATCLAGFEPITSSWQDCKLAAVALSITGDSIGHVDYHTQKGSQAFGTDVPQGCFRDAVTNRVYFNPGKGGSGRKENDQNKWSDRVVCRQTNADYSYTYGNTCPDGYRPITYACSSAAEYLGLPVDSSIVDTANNPCKVGEGIVCQLEYDPSRFVSQHTEL